MGHENSPLSSEDIKDVLRTIELYEDDEVCDSPIIVEDRQARGRCA
jgi:hypothetical protein